MEKHDVPLTPYEEAMQALDRIIAELDAVLDCWEKEE